MQIHKKIKTNKNFVAWRFEEKWVIQANRQATKYANIKVQRVMCRRAFRATFARSLKRKLIKWAH